MGLAPFACAGNGFWRVSVAFWLLVPGSERSLLVLSPIRCDMATSAMAAKSQIANTTNRRRTENRATAYRILVMPPPFLFGPRRTAIGIVLSVRLRVNRTWRGGASAGAHSG